MITSFEDVKREFFALFLGGLQFDQQRFLTKTLNIPSQNYWGEITILQIPVTYYKKSFFNLTELPNESYPIISIQDFPASPVDNWNTFVQENYVKKLNVAENKWEVFNEPHSKRMCMRFDVSVAEKSDYNFNWIQKWFYSNFQFEKSKCVFKFKKTFEDLNGVTITDELDYIKLTNNLTTFDKVVENYVPVFYEFGEVFNSERSDGIIETTFTFELYFWINFATSQKVAVPQKVSVILNTEKVEKLNISIQ
jgi:hypothetical protein